MSNRVIIRAREVKKPISQETIGFRLEAAIPNMAGKAFGHEVPSFKRPYFVAESSDMNYVTDNDIRRFCETLKFQGYKQFEYLE